MFLTPATGSSNQMRFAITTNGGSAECQATADGPLPTGWHHVAVTINATDDTIVLYLDGRPAGSNNQASLCPHHLGMTTHNWLGRSQYVADGYYKGLIDDFRIYNQSLSQSQVDAVMDPYCVAHWALDEAAGTIAHDSKGRFDGTLHGNPTWMPDAGIVDGALAFDGVDDYVDCSSDPNLNNSTGHITLALWVRTNDCGNGQYNPYVNTGDRSYNLQHHVSNHLEFCIYDDAWYWVRYPVTTSFNGEWHHMAGTYDGQKLALYVDAQLRATSSHVGSIASSTDAVNLGGTADLPDRLYCGALDDVRIYNRALGQAEIQTVAEQ
jgi:hypothetical protein